MAQNLETIVQRMIDAGESEDNIATVIKGYKAEEKPKPEPKIDTKPLTTESTDLVDFAPIPKTEEEPSMMEKVYRGIFEAPKFITEPASKFATSMAQPGLEDSPAYAMAKGFVGGAAEGAANLLSPANILTLGRGKIGQIAARVLGGGQVAHGVSELGKGNYATGAGDIAFGALGLSTPHAEIPEPEVTPRPTVKIPEKGAVRPPQKEFNPASVGFGNKLDEITQLVKGAGLEEPKTPIEVVGEEKPTRTRPSPEQLAEFQQRRSAAMDVRNKSNFKGIVPDEDIPKVAELNKNNDVGKMANKSQKKKIWPEIRDANRAILTSFDLSALARQGKPLLMTKAYWTSIDDMAKAWGSERAYDAVMQSINEHPNFKSITDPITGRVTKSLAEKAGLNIGSAEQFNSNIADKLVPGVRRSERAYNAFLNKLRADHFNSMINDYEASGVKIKNDLPKLKQLATFINDATGRGSLGKLDRIAPQLNEVFFAPKLMASRVNMYRRWLNPASYSSADPIMRKQVLKSLLSTVGFGMAVGELGRLAGAQVNNDPDSADFRKVKIGNTRIDPFSGFQQYAVGASRMITGKSVSSTSNKQFDLSNPKYGQPSRLSVAGQFLQNKLSPVYSLVASWMQGKDWDGKPFELKKALLDRTVPIVMQDLMDLYKEDPKSFPPGLFKENPTATKIGAAALPLIGEGIQTYGR